MLVCSLENTVSGLYEEGCCEGLLGLRTGMSIAFLQMVQWDKEWLKRDVMALRTFAPRCACIYICDVVDVNFVQLLI